MKTHIRLISCKPTSTKCFVPVRTFHSHSNQIPPLKTVQSLQAKLMTKCLLVNNNHRSFFTRLYGTDFQTNTDQAVVLQKQITVAMTEKDFAKAISLLEKLKNLTQDDKALHDVYEKLGICYHATSKLKEGIECYQRTLELSKKLNDPKMIAKSLSLLGALQIAGKDFENGNATLKEGLKLATEINDTTLKGHINSSLGISFANQDIPDAAIKYFMDSLEDFKQLRNIEVVQTLTRFIAQEYTKMKAYELANSYWEQFVKFSRNKNDKKAELKGLSAIASNFMRISKPRDSKITFEKALVLAKEIQSTEAERECLLGLAKACEVMGETVQAKRYSNEALKISQDNMDVSGEINALIIRATQSMAAKEFDSCVKDAEEILALSQKYNQKGGEMYARMLLGAMAEHSQEWTAAKDHFEKALELSKVTKDTKSTRKCQDMLTAIYFNLRNFSAAVPLLHDLLKAYESDNDDLNRLRCLSRMHLCYKNLGKQQHAEIYLKLCHILANQLVERGVVPSLEKLNELMQAKPVA